MECDKEQREKRRLVLGDSDPQCFTLDATCSIVTAAAAVVENYFNQYLTLYFPSFTAGGIHKEKKKYTCNDLNNTFIVLITWSESVRISMNSMTELRITVLKNCNPCLDTIFFF